MYAMQLPMSSSWGSGVGSSRRPCLGMSDLRRDRRCVMSCVRIGQAQHARFSLSCVSRGARSLGGYQAVRVGVFEVARCLVRLQLGVAESCGAVDRAYSAGTARTEVACSWGRRVGGRWRRSSIGSPRSVWRRWPSRRLLRGTAGHRPSPSTRRSGSVCHRRPGPGTVPSLGCLCPGQRPGAPCSASISAS